MESIGKSTAFDTFERVLIQVGVVESQFAQLNEFATLQVSYGTIIKNLTIFRRIRQHSNNNNKRMISTKLNIFPRESLNFSRRIQQPEDTGVFV